MQFEKGRKLKDIKLREVSFVETPATRKPFLFFKSASGEHETDEEQEEVEIMDKELKELLEAFLDEKIEDDDDIEKAEKLTEKVVNAIKEALKILNEYKDALPDDAKKAVDTLVKYATTKYPYPKPYKKSKEEESDLEKAGKKLSKATMEKLLAMRKLIDELLPDDIKKMAEEIDKDELAFEMLQKMHDKLFAEPEDDEEDEEDDEEGEETGKIMKFLKGIDARLEKLEKMKGKKRELDDEEDDEEDDKDPFPSIPI
jgi:hypothetical protein